MAFQIRLRWVLIVLLVVAATIYACGAVWNETSLQRFYGLQHVADYNAFTAPWVGSSTTVTAALSTGKHTHNSTEKNNNIVFPVAFEKHEGVVIVTKIHGPHQVDLLYQMLCLLDSAYNHKPLYDIVVFTAIPMTPEMIVLTEHIVAPANVTFVVDNRGLHEEIAALSPTRRANFYEACQVTEATASNLTWFSECPGRIAYNWQAEFRSWHIWTHPALVDYKYMMWLDSDAFCTKEWNQDPIHTMMENDLVIFFDNWPKGSHKGKDVQSRIYKAFNVSLCKLKLKNGQFQSKVHFDEKSCKQIRIPNVHGFFHITNLDFFRSPLVQTWGETWIGDGFLQRRYDDQAAVTIAPAILAPDRAWDMYSHKVRLEVYHNLHLDGKRKKRVGGFKRYWETTVQDQFPMAAQKCLGHIMAGS